MLDVVSQNSPCISPCIPPHAPRKPTSSGVAAFGMPLPLAPLTATRVANCPCASMLRRVTSYASSERSSTLSELRATWEDPPASPSPRILLSLQKIPFRFLPLFFRQFGFLSWCAIAYFLTILKKRIPRPPTADDDLFYPFVFLCGA